MHGGLLQAFDQRTQGSVHGSLLFFPARLTCSRAARENRWRLTNAENFMLAVLISSLIIVTLK